MVYVIIPFYQLKGAVWGACNQLTSIQGDLSPLMLASQQGHADIVALLIENHADLDMRNEVHVQLQNHSLFATIIMYHTTNMFEGIEQNKKSFMVSMYFVHG